jgi:hypothetical protein
MKIRPFVLLAAVALAAALVPASAPGAASWRADARTATKGLQRAVATGQLGPADAAYYRGVVGRAVHALERLPGSRAANLAAVLHDVAAQAGGYIDPRAVTLFRMLEVNTQYLARHAVPRPGRDVEDADGIVYRAFPEQGLQFHPLANFARLNARLAAHDDHAAELQALALLQRAVPRAGGLTWEYEFPFGGGRPPWTSGMVQAVAAQAFARAGPIDPQFLQVATRAYRAIPGKLLQWVRGVPWIRIYSFSREAVLNSQLQTVISLGDYAALAQDASAEVLAGRLDSAARALLPRFDTGYWSLYSLGGPEATLNYHTYVVTLLAKLAARTKDPFWSQYATRFKAYLTEPPALASKGVPGALYPQPADGFRDSAWVSFWVSKASRVTVRAAGGVATTRVGEGWHRLLLRPRPLPPGSYPATLRAVDLAGNEGELDLPPVELRRDTEPPRVAATLSRKRLFWRASDDATPWLRLTVVLGRDGEHRALPLGRRPLRGSLRLSPPPGTWSATLVAADSSGNATRRPLGLLRVG